ncbi:hypothetical protein ZHAS_00012908 [Anopheles sinensis]|uniref:Uncharacterized protein n=1 Tax=Anopheles sinensis TaxID=74873 RepID=A0A084W412_ANOSI|nr:hypothetical protein ZHAS_00012908 [Anopheles sinensis]
MQPLVGVLLVAMVYFGHMQTSVLANAQPPTEKIPLAIEIAFVELQGLFFLSKFF